jgi:hypothetical protein
LRTGQGILTSICGDRIPRDSTLSYITIEVDSTEASNTYNVEILSSPTNSPSVLSTLLLPASVRGDSTTVSVGISANTEVGARVVRNTGAGASTFNYISVNMGLTD